MKGGKLLSEGGYGCVFFPSINCNGSSMKTKKYVSKIQKYDKSAKNEIKIGKKTEKSKMETQKEKQTLKNMEHIGKMEKFGKM